MLNIQQRKRVYQFFARALVCPDGRVLAGWVAEYGEIAGLLDDAAPPVFAELADPAALGEAYTGLFISRLGGVPAPPYGSVYLDEGILMGPSTRAVLGCYQDAGLSFEATTEPPDFLPTELEFLYFLVAEEERALAARDLAAARRATERQRDFLSRWLLPWLEPFCQRLQTADAAGFYGWAGRALLGFVRHELGWLNRLA